MILKYMNIVCVFRWWVLL